MKIIFETVVQRNWQQVKSGFNRDLFLSLRPPGVSINLIRFDGCTAGDVVHLELKTAGLKQIWIGHITKDEQTGSEWSFVDEGHKIPWPLKKWRHHHRVVSLGDHSSRIIDDINFECVHSWMNPLMFPVLWCSFAIRPRKYKKFFLG